MSFAWRLNGGHEPRTVNWLHYGADCTPSEYEHSICAFKTSLTHIKLMKLFPSREIKWMGKNSSFISLCQAVFKAHVPCLYSEESTCSEGATFAAIQSATLCTIFEKERKIHWIHAITQWLCFGSKTPMNLLLSTPSPPAPTHTVFAVPSLDNLNNDFPHWLGLLLITQLSRIICMLSFVPPGL